MSFSSNIKEELSRNETGARHCKIAEIAGFLRFGGNISLEPEHYEIQIQTETVSAAKRFINLSKMCLIFMRRLMLDETNF